MHVNGVQKYAHTRIHTHIHAYTHMYTNIHTYRDMKPMHIHTRIHTYIHTYRDMKPENVLLSAKLTGSMSDHVTCKLGDVGLAALRADPAEKGKRRETTRVGKVRIFVCVFV
jgi:hypothetical protein